MEPVSSTPPIAPQPPRPRWDMGDFYTQAWRLTFTHRKLWILGLAVAILATTGSGNSSSRSSSSSSRSTQSPSPTASASASLTGPESQLPFSDKVNIDQLDDAVEQFGYRLTTNVVPGLRTIPVPAYALIGTEILVLALVGIVIAVAASAWSRGTLIHGIAQAETMQTVDLALAGSQGRRITKTFIKIDYYPWLKPLIILFGVSVACLVAAVVDLPVLLPFLVIGMIVYGIIMLFRILPAQTWAYRYSSHYGDPYGSAYTRGRASARGNVGKMILLGFVNGLIDMVTTIILLIPLGALSVIGVVFFFLHPSAESLISLAAAFIVALIASAPFLTLRAAIVQVFKNSAWHFAFKTVKVDSTGTQS